MIDRVLDHLLPTAEQPAAVMATAGDPDVIPSRLGAAAIDLIICYVLIESPLVYVFSELFPGAWGALGGWAFAASLLVLLPIYATYGFVCEWRYGRTPGKVNRQLLVVMADGGECTLRAAAVRNLLRYVDVLGIPPLVVGVVSMVVSDGRRVGDFLAGTVVVRSAAPAEMDAVVHPDMETDAAARGGEDD